jgi:hypothetical protein
MHSKPVGVYRYYVKAVGPMIMLVYLILGMSYGFLFNFPSK